jgi:hypothetical protein
VSEVIVVSSPTLAVQDVQFLRNEDDNEALEVPAYSPGDTVCERSNIMGFLRELKTSIDSVTD